MPSRYVCEPVFPKPDMCLAACLHVCIPHVCAGVFLHLTSQTFTDYLLCAQFWLGGGGLVPSFKVTSRFGGVQCVCAKACVICRYPGTRLTLAQVKPSVALVALVRPCLCAGVRMCEVHLLVCT